MTELSDLEARVAALEARVEVVAADATAARHLAAARDRDLADLGLKVDANRSVINALGEQTAARFTRLEQQLEEQITGVRTEMRSGFAEVNRGFAEMRGKLDQAAAGQQKIGQLLTTLVDRPLGGYFMIPDSNSRM
jgi:hypothetical protein